jgi:hypothetical protein
MVAYLEDFSARHRLRIRFNSRMVSIEKVGETFRLLGARGEIYTADCLLVATLMFAVSSCRYEKSFAFPGKRCGEYNCPAQGRRHGR